MKKIKLVIIIGLLLIGCLFSVNQIYAAQLEMKTVSLEGIEDIYLDIGGAEIEFDKSSNQAELPVEFKVRKKNGRLYISSPERNNNKDYKVIIGTAEKFEKVDLDAGGAEIKGVLEAEKIYLSGGGIDIDAHLTGDRVYIEGGGLKVEGRINAEYLSVSGAGMDINLAVERVKDLDLEGAALSADIKYLDSWAGVRNLSIEGVGGSLDLLVPKENESSEDGELRVDKQGLIINVDVDYY